MQQQLYRLVKWFCFFNVQYKWAKSQQPFFFFYIKGERHCVNTAMALIWPKKTDVKRAVKEATYNTRGNGPSQPLISHLSSHPCPPWLMHLNDHQAVYDSPVVKWRSCFVNLSAVILVGNISRQCYYHILLFVVRESANTETTFPH